MPPKKKQAPAAAGPPAAAASTSSAAQPAGSPAAAKEAEKLYKQIRKASDPKLLPKLKAQVDAAPSAATLLMLAKAHLLMAAELALKKGQTTGAAGEDALEEEVMRELMAALEAAAAGVSANGRDKSLRCLLLTAFLGSLMRGRGGLETIGRRVELLEGQLKFAKVALKLGNKLSWLPAAAEGAPPKWPFEEFKSQAPVDEPLKHAIEGLDDAVEVDKVAQERGRPVFLPSAILGSPQEVARHVQERLPFWPVLPTELRKGLASKFHLQQGPGPMEQLLAGAGSGPAAAAAGPGGREEGKQLISRDQKQRMDAQERQADKMAKLAERTAKEQRRKAEAEAAARALAAAAAAKRQAQRAAVAEEKLGSLVAEAGDSRDAQLSALLGALRMRVGDMREETARLARDKGLSELQAALTKAAIERLTGASAAGASASPRPPSAGDQQQAGQGQGQGAGQQHFCAWHPEMAAQVASEAAGGPGAPPPAALGSGLVVESDPKRVAEKLRAALECRVGDMRGLFARKEEAVPLLKVVRRNGEPEDKDELPIAHFSPLELSASLGGAPELMPTGEPHESDVRFLRTAQERGLAAAAALVYKRAANLLFIMQPGSIEPLAPAEDEAVQAAPEQPGAEQPGAEQPGAEQPGAEQAGQAAAAGSAAAAGAHAGSGEGAGQEQAGAGGSDWAAGGTVVSQAADALQASLGSTSLVSDYLLQTFADLQGHAEALTRTKPVDPETVILEPTYGWSYDMTTLLLAFLHGNRVLDLHEAREKGEDPARWEWWHYKALGMGMVASKSAHLDAQLYVLEPDDAKRAAVAAAADAFSRWLLRHCTRQDRWCSSPPPPGWLEPAGTPPAPPAEAEPAPAPAAEPAPAAQAASSAGGGEGGEGVGGASAALDAWWRAQQADEEEEEGAEWVGRAAEAVEVELLTGFSEVTAEWIVRGLGAISLSRADLPAGGLGVTGEGGTVSVPPAALQWLSGLKEAGARRVLLALRALEGERMLAPILLDRVVDFIADAAPQNVYEAVCAAATAGSSGGSGAAAGAGGEGESPPGLSTRDVLSMLPTLPLGSLHTLLAFLTVQTGFRALNMASVQEAAKAGEEAMLAACLQVAAGEGGSSKEGGGKAGGGKVAAADGGGKEASLTQAGLAWLLLSTTHPLMPFPSSHFQAEDAPVPDMAAQLASFSQPAEAPAAAPADKPGTANGGQSGAAARPPDAGAAGGGGEGAAAAAGAAPAAPPDAAGEAGGQPSSQQLPGFMRLSELVASWQPPEASLEGHLRMLCCLALPEWRPASSESEELASLAAQFRLGVFYSHIAGGLVLAGTDSHAKLMTVLSPDHTWGKAVALIKRYLSHEQPLLGLQLPPPAQVWDATLSGILPSLAVAELHLNMLDFLRLGAAMRNNADNLDAYSQLLPREQAAAAAAPAGPQRAAAKRRLRNVQHHVDSWRANLGTQDGLTERFLKMQQRIAHNLPTEDAAPFADPLRRAFMRLHGAPLSREERRALQQQALESLQGLEDYAHAVLTDLQNQLTHIQLLAQILAYKARDAYIQLERSCQFNAVEQAARQMVMNLLPAAWEAQLSGAKAADDAKALLLEEEKERERQRQIEAERRKAERKAKAKKAKKAAAAALSGIAGGGGGKGAARGDWRDELAEVAAGERDGAEEQEEDEDGAAKAAGKLSPEGQANLARLWSLAEQNGSEPGGADGEDWQQAGGHARQPKQRQRQGQEKGEAGWQQQQAQQQQQARTPKKQPDARAAPAPKPAPSRSPGDAPAMLPPRQRPASAQSAAAAPAAAAAAAAAAAGVESAGSWSFGEGQPAAGEGEPWGGAASAGSAGSAGQSWAQQAQQAQQAPEDDDDDVDALLAAMNIHSSHDSPPASSHRQPQQQQQQTAVPEGQRGEAGAEPEEEEEDEDLKAAIAASLEMAQQPHKPGPKQGTWAAAAAAGADLGSPQSSWGAAPAGSGSGAVGEDEVAGAVGLRNESGEYNCFLNVVVQCLWQCREFREEVASWSPEFLAAGDPVVSALHGLFQALQERQQDDWAQADAAAASPGRPAASPGRPGTPGPAASPAGKKAGGSSSSGGGKAPVPGAWGGQRQGSGSAPPSPVPAARAWAAVAGGGEAGSAANGGGAAASGGGATRERAAVDPTPLRQALAGLAGYSFDTGEMHDPAELVLCIFDQIIDVYQRQQGEAAGQPPQPSSASASQQGEGQEGFADTPLQLTFGLSVKEQVDCPSCHKSTQHNSYTQYFYNTHATMLHMLRCTVDGLSMGGLLREAEAQHQKSCDTDVGGCGRSTAVNHFLERAPRVFTLQLTWSSNRAEPEEIAGVMAALEEEVDLGEVYQGVERGLHRYRLRSMVCYYGQHYQALVLVPDAGGWLMFDDTRVTRVGAWADVKRKCEAGRVQPSVLFFEAV